MSESSSSLISMRLARVRETSVFINWSICSLSKSWLPPSPKKIIKLGTVSVLSVLAKCSIIEVAAKYVTIKTFQAHHR